MLNKRYPESTVIETYRLFEATSFLQISKQLPTSATPDVELDCEQDEVNEKKVEEIITVSLTKEQLKNLDRYYLDDIRIQCTNKAIQQRKGNEQQHYSIA